MKFYSLGSNVYSTNINSGKILFKCVETDHSITLDNDYCPVLNKYIFRSTSVLTYKLSPYNKLLGT